MYHPNLLRNDDFIKHYQKIHCDFDVVKPKNTLTKKTNKYTQKKSIDIMYTFKKDKQIYSKGIKCRKRKKNHKNTYINKIITTFNLHINVFSILFYV